jgi:hypothetical protein
MIIANEAHKSQGRVVPFDGEAMRGTNAALPRADFTQEAHWSSIVISGRTDASQYPPITSINLA